MNGRSGRHLPIQKHNSEGVVERQEVVEQNRIHAGAEPAGLLRMSNYESAVRKVTGLKGIPQRPA
jgi:hypothetical protein